ncbi:MAG: MoxR family ATPase [Phycisphaerales bacterium]|nr:MoxR family ATPase [Phycisphaerales bacterium]
MTQSQVPNSESLAAPAQAGPLERLRAQLSSVYYGNTTAVERLLTCLLARGHLLIEDVPGVGKTVLATALAKSIGGTFARVQCTPDLLPSDITGVTVFDRDRNDFRFQPGPVFNNIIVADEINRTTPRTQAALLEAMAEDTVTVDGTTRQLPQPFMVIATQNPYEFEGTYFLPENQLDRFLVRISLGYPAPTDEARIIQQQPARNELRSLQPVVTDDEVCAMQQAVDAVHMDESLVNYVIALATASREHDDVQVGVSPRGALALAQAGRATALLDGRDYCTPDDIVANVLPVCAHRIISRTAMHEGDTGTARRIMQQVLETVASPA